MKSTYIIIGLALLLAGFIYYSIDQSIKLKSANNSIKILETDSKAVEAENQRLIDSLDSLSEKRKEDRKATADKIDSLERLPKTPRYDKTIDTVRDSNRIDSLFARYYGQSETRGS